MQSYNLGSCCQHTMVRYSSERRSSSTVRKTRDSKAKDGHGHPQASLRHQKPDARRSSCESVQSERTSANTVEGNSYRRSHLQHFPSVSSRSGQESFNNTMAANFSRKHHRGEQQESSVENFEGDTSRQKSLLRSSSQSGRDSLETTERDSSRPRSRLRMFSRQGSSQSKSPPVDSHYERDSQRKSRHKRQESRDFSQRGWVSPEVSLDDSGSLHRSRTHQNLYEDSCNGVVDDSPRHDEARNHLQTPPLCSLRRRRSRSHVHYVESSLMRDNSKYRRHQSSYASVGRKLDDNITVDDLSDSPRSSHQSFNDRRASCSRPETDSMSYDEYSINPTYSGVEKHKPQMSGHTYEARDDLENDDRALALPKIVIIPQESFEDNVVTDIGSDSPPARCTSSFAGANICRGCADSLLHSEEVPSSEIYGTVPNIGAGSSSIDSPHHKITLRKPKRNISAHRALNTVIARPSERSARACTLNKVYSSSREVSTSLQVRDEVISSTQEKSIRHPDPEENYHTRASNEVHSKVLSLHNEVAGGKKPEETNDAVNVKAGTYYPFCNPLSDALSSFTTCIVACIQVCNGDATSPEETHFSEKVLQTVDSIQADSVAIQKEALSNEERVKSKKKKIAKIFPPLRDHLRIEKRVGRRILPRFTKSLVEKLPKNKRRRSGSKHMYPIELSEDTVETRDYASSFLAEPITDSNVKEKPIVRRTKEKSAGIVSKKFRSRSKQEPPTPRVLADLVELHKSIKRDILISTDSSRSMISDLSVSTHDTQRSRTVPTRQRKRGARFAKTLNRVISRGLSSRKTPRKTKSSASKTAEFQEISSTAEKFPDDEAVELALQIGYKTKVEGASKPSQHGSSIVESEPASLLSKSQASSTSQRKGHQVDVENKCVMPRSGSTKSVSPLGTFQVTSIMNNTILTPVYEESESPLNSVTTQESFIDEVQTVALESTSSHLARETSAISHASNESKNSALEGIKQSGLPVVPSTVAATRNTSSIPDGPRISNAFFAANQPTRFVEERSVDSRTVSSESCPSFSSDGSETVAMSPSTEAIVGGLDNTISINRSNSTERDISLSTVDKNSIGKASIEDGPKESGLTLGLRKTISLGSNIITGRPSNEAGMDAHFLEPKHDIQFIKRSLSLPALRFINSVP